MPFTFQVTPVLDVIVVQYGMFGDARGGFAELFRNSEFAAAGLPTGFIQENFSTSVQSVLRGLHYQKDPYAQGKLVMVLCGEIFDVAVDIRRGSPTYAKWAGETLSRENRRMLWIPPGFAHGFCVLSATADVVYRVTGSEYTPAAERGIIWNDPEIRIAWPIEHPMLGVNDSHHPRLANADANFTYGR